MTHEFTMRIVKQNRCACNAFSTCCVEAEQILHNPPLAIFNSADYIIFIICTSYIFECTVQHMIQAIWKQKRIENNVFTQLFSNVHEATARRYLEHNICVSKSKSNTIYGQTESWKNLACYLHQRSQQLLDRSCQSLYLSSFSVILASRIINSFFSSSDVDEALFQ